MNRRIGLILWLPLAAIACASALTADQVAQLRGGVRPDSIDVLIAQAIADTGEYREVGDMAYGFTGSYRALNALSQLPSARPRLVECMGWDRRARATWDGHRLLVGVVCFQAIVESSYFQKRNQRNWPEDFADSAFVDYQNPTLQELRRAQRLWREQLLRDPL